jgi:type II secretory pathway component PulF
MMYQYKALKKDKVISGKLEASSPEDAVLYLKNNNYFPIEVKRMDAGNSAVFDSIFNRVQFSDIVDLTRQH